MKHFICFIVLLKAAKSAVPAEFPANPHMQNSKYLVKSKIGKPFFYQNLDLFNNCTFQYI